jgi:hypothetical protein
MIVVGARFRALAGARAALRTVRASVAVAAGDVGVRALGSTGYETAAEGFVVAGRFEPGDVEAVIRIFHAHGGRIVVRRIDGARPAARRRVVRHAGRAGSALAHRASSEVPASGSLPRKRLRRPSPPLRVRTARCHRIER